MRITNQMTTNRMLLNITRNMGAVNDIYTQLTSGKKIQMPSDNPIIASRALKFRTNISETEQYISNVKQGISWMDITRQAIANMTESLDSIKELCIEGSTGTFNLNNKQTFANQLQSILEQMEGEMNVTYAGRYVLSGYRTDKPPVITKDIPNAKYSIEQSFKPGNIETATVYTKAGPSDVPETSVVNRLKLPYTGVTGMSELVIYDANGNQVDTIPINETLPTANTATSLATDSAYKPDPSMAYYIQDTGEIILGESAMAKINANANGRIDVSYTKEGLKKGDLNPEVYFNCTDIKSGKTFSMDTQNIQYEFGVNTRVSINNLAKDTLTATLYGDMRALLQLVNSVTLSTDKELVAKYSAENPDLTGAEVDELVKKHKADEQQYYEGILHDAFSNMLSIVDGHASQVSKEYTQLGSRMNRLELIQTRLVEDRLSYFTLMSDNENVDYLEATMNLNAANYVYQMALKAGGGIMQTSLADFIR